MSEITDYKTKGEQPNILYAMFEEDTRILKFFYPHIFCLESAMAAKAKDLIKGVIKHRGFNEPSSTQRLVKIKIEKVEYLEGETNGETN